MKKEVASHFFKSINYLGIGLTLYACAGFISREIGIDSIFFDYLILFPVYILGQIVNAVVTAGKKAARKTPIAIIKLSFYLSVLSLWELIAIVLFMPVLLVSMISVQFIAIVFILSGVLLGMLAYENLIGDIEGYRSLITNWRQAITGFIVFAVSGTITCVQFSLGEGDGDYIIDKGIELINGIREYFVARAEKCMNQE